MRRLLPILLLAALAIDPAALPAQELRTYDTQYYVIHTDLDDADAREAAIRMTKMAEEYHARTRAFSGAIRQKFPFHLYRNEADYVAAGGARGTSGMFRGKTLMAVAGDRPGSDLWYTIQHEGFHQFAAAVIRGNLPMWVNEGLADYFGEAVFTGDGFVTGVIPQWRLERIRRRFEAGQFRPIEQMLELSHAQWNEELSIVNYDQSWAMAHFLAHGEGGRFQPNFERFMMSLSRGEHWQGAWRQAFGSVDGFEQRWRDWWTNLPDHPTDGLFAEAATATLTSFLARAVSRGQNFSSMDELRQAAAAEKIEMHPQDWLPPRLIKQAFADVAEMESRGFRWSLEFDPRTRKASVVCSTPTAQKLTGNFTLSGARVRKVAVTRSSALAAPARLRP